MNCFKFAVVSKYVLLRCTSVSRTLTREQCFTTPTLKRLPWVHPFASTLRARAVKSVPLLQLIPPSLSRERQVDIARQQFLTLQDLADRDDFHRFPGGWRGRRGAGGKHDDSVWEAGVVEEGDEWRDRDAHVGKVGRSEREGI